MATETTDADRRRKHYWNLWNFTVGRGLEIGPLHRTIVQRGEADVHYLDVHDQETLRQHYADDDNVDPALIPAIDYALIQDDGRIVALRDAARPGAPYAWVVASHVIEHVPDVIGWLDELADLVSDDGALVLAVPDRRYCFDVHRPPTTVGQMIDAHLAGDTRPSVRAVYDYFSTVVDCQDMGALWVGRAPTFDSRIHSFDVALTKAEEARTGTYVDSHVWLFTPESFMEQMHELRITGRSSWFVQTLVPTPLHDSEFRVVMRRLPRSATHADEVASELRAGGERPEWFSHPELSAHVEVLEAQVERLHLELAQRQLRVEKLRGKLRRQRRRAAAEHRRLDEVLSSRRWRWTGALTSPPREAFRLLRRR